MPADLSIREREATDTGTIPVSVMVITKNEELDLPKCLRSLEPFDEVFVVDSNSTDRTQEIARDMGAHVVPFEWNGRYPKKRQWALENLELKHDWVLMVDADEEVPPALAKEIHQTLAPGSRHAGYFVALDYFFLGRRLRRGFRYYKLALFDRHRSRYLQYDDLEAGKFDQEGHYQPSVDGSVGRLRSRMVHKDRSSLYEYFDRHNRYSDWEAVLRSKGGITQEAEANVGARYLLKRIFNRMPAKGLVAFLDAYVLRAGFLDGRVGFHMAMARAFYYWQIGLKTKERESQLRSGQSR